MMRGRPRKPVEIHKAEGTYRADRHLPDAAEAPKFIEVPLPPPCFGRLRKVKKNAEDKERIDAARTQALHEIWYATCHALVDMRLMTVADLVLVEMYCREVFLMRTAYEKAMEVQDDFIMETQNENGTLKRQTINAWIGLYHASGKRCMEIGARLGFSPMDRTKIGVGYSDKKDPAAHLLKKI